MGTLWGFLLLRCMPHLAVLYFPWRSSRNEREGLGQRSANCELLWNGTVSSPALGECPRPPFQQTLTQQPPGQAVSHCALPFQSKHCSEHACFKKGVLLSQKCFGAWIWARINTDESPEFSAFRIVTHMANAVSLLLNITPCSPPWCRGYTST